MTTRFSYTKHDMTAIATQLELREAFEAVEDLVDRLPNSRATSLVYIKLEEAYMWAGKAIRDAQIERTGEVDDDV